MYNCEELSENKEMKGYLYKEIKATATQSQGHISIWSIGQWLFWWPKGYSIILITAILTDQCLSCN